MPVEASFSQAYLLHHRPDAAAVTAVLAEGACSDRENVLVVLRFVFSRISHGLEYDRTQCLSTRSRNAFVHLNFDECFMPGNQPTNVLALEMLRHSIEHSQNSLDAEELGARNLREDQNGVVSPE